MGVMANSRRRQIDPLAALIESGASTVGPQGVQLAGIRLDIEIKCGLIVAQATRTFENTGSEPVEALLSFPVPSTAVCYELTAEIDGRSLRGICRQRSRARQGYEDAIGEGRAAVLYEEVLRGIHMLSVGNLGPGAAAQVSVRWVDSIVVEGGRAWYRIPMTVGQVYGHSGLPETDEPMSGGPTLQADLQLTHDARAVMLAGGSLVEAEGGTGKLEARAPTDAPIDFRIDGWKPGLLDGRSEAGRSVVAGFTNTLASDDSLDVDLLVDVSGSMSGRSGRNRRSKSSEVNRALKSLAAQIRPFDTLSLWAFRHDCRKVGEVLPGRDGRGRFKGLIEMLPEPSGGTEIGLALSTSSDSGRRDVLLVTDGLSYNLDVLKHARSGRRVFVILVGEDSLEAKVGHLAALTGGGVYYSSGRDVERPVMVVLERIRSPWAKPLTEGSHSDGIPQSIRVSRGSAIIDVLWGEKEDSDAPRATPIERAVAAFSAGITIPALSDETAGSFATNQGIVSHLSSLVLVDEHGKIQDSAPVVEKLLLSTPGSQGRLPRPATQVPEVYPSAPAPKAPRSGWPARWPPETEIWEWLRATGRMVNWTKHRRDLRMGRLDGLPLRFAIVARVLAAHPRVQGFAKEQDLAPERVAIALVASAVANRSAPAATVQETQVPAELRPAFVEFADGLASLPRREIESLFSLPD